MMNRFFRRSFMVLTVLWGLALASGPFLPAPEGAPIVTIEYALSVLAGLGCLAMTMWLRSRRQNQSGTSWQPS